MSDSTPGSGRVRRSKIRRRSKDTHGEAQPTRPELSWKLVAIIFALIALISTSVLVIILVSGSDSL
ncbi:MAG: hypothetical protein P8J87_13550 [Verrucomicrobiales bacterium]|nr:hypothetical protein [Verrucomicrobiales bacterium]